MHVFPYSPRQGTPAARMPQVDGAIIKSRARTMRSTAENALHKFLDGCIGETQDGVLESGSRIRLGNFATVRIAGGRASIGDVVGDIVRVSIAGRDGGELFGEIAPTA